MTYDDPDKTAANPVADRVVDPVSDNPVTGDPVSTDATGDDTPTDGERHDGDTDEKDEKDQKDQKDDKKGPLATAAAAVASVFGRDGSDDEPRHRSDDAPAEEGRSAPVGAEPTAASFGTAPAGEDGVPDEPPTETTAADDAAVVDNSGDATVSGDDDPTDDTTGDTTDDIAGAGPAAAGGSGLTEEEERQIAEDRERRLDPANRPENAEVDNTADIPAPGEGSEDQVGSDPRLRFLEIEVSEEEQRAIEEERERRLDPANRPENAEVDNTRRTFDGEGFKD